MEDRFIKLQKRGAQKQRPLWASTGTKNPAYPDVLYVESLVGKDTVNTVPPATLAALIDHGKVDETINWNLFAARDHFSKLEEIGISFSDITSELEIEGVDLFKRHLTP